MTKPSHRTEGALAIIGVFVLSALATTWLAKGFLTSQVANTRYLLPTAALPLIFVWPFAAGRAASLFGSFGSDRSTSRGTASRLMVSGTGTAVFAWVLLTGIPVAPSLAFASYSPTSACIDDALRSTGSTSGIAHYWDSKTAEYQSQHGVEIASVDYLLRHDQFNQSSRRFATTYDFALTSKQFPIPVHLAAALSGPSTKTECGRWTVHDFGEDGLIMPTVTDGDSLTYDGCQLAVSMGQRRPEGCQLTTTNPNNETPFVSYGPYVTVQESGVYHFELSYQANAPQSEPIGEWDLIVTLGPEEVEVVDGGTLHGTAGKLAVISAQVQSDGFEQIPVAEMRTWSNGVHDYSVVGLTITRQDNG